MQFHVGPYSYRLAISDREVFDAEGSRLEGCAVEGRRLLILSRVVEPERREEVALHELIHAWAFHVPTPRTEEERCQLHAMIAEQFRRDLESQGGREAMMQLQPQHVPHLGRPAPAQNPRAAKEVFGRPDRVICSRCDSETMCGSVTNGEPELHAATGQLRMQRWFVCETCGTLTVWLERCTDDGTPLGEYIPNPPPRMMDGAEAARFMRERRELAGVAAMG